ncbi:lysyl oxidase homolog 3 isoform X3 [Columba livia]|uniref:lysyl oxidase homolog 3 isoform X3 n=1 Tax=Columba livia TaxID=8932 RepID=UPI0031B9DA00
MGLGAAALPEQAGWPGRGCLSSHAAAALGWKGCKEQTVAGGFRALQSCLPRARAVRRRLGQGRPRAQEQGDSGSPALVPGSLCLESCPAGQQQPRPCPGAAGGHPSWTWSSALPGCRVPLPWPRRRERCSGTLRGRAASAGLSGGRPGAAPPQQAVSPRSGQCPPAGPRAAGRLRAFVPGGRCRPWSALRTGRGPWGDRPIPGRWAGGAVPVLPVPAAGPGRSARAGAAGRPLTLGHGAGRAGAERGGTARLGSARLGSAPLRTARLHTARLASPALGPAWFGPARLGSAGPGSAPPTLGWTLSLGATGAAQPAGTREPAAMGSCGTWAGRELLVLLSGMWLCAAQPTPPGPTRSPAPPLKFRLAGYPRKHNEGRVEVFYNDEWGTICDDDFTLANAHVLCRHLGFVAATGWAHSAKYGTGVGRIWLDNLNCAGGEKSVGDCKHRGWGNSDCSHEEDAGIICKDERIPGFKDSNVIETEQSHVEEVRLRPVVSSARRQLPVTEGIVEVRYKDGWAQICDQGWDSRNSRVVCGMMGFPAEKKVNRNFYKRLKRAARMKGRSARPGSRRSRLFMERQQLNYRLHSVSCMGTEVHLSMCSFEFYRGNASAACAAGTPAVVSCVPGPLFATGNGHKKKQRQQQQGQPRLRLKGGAKVGEGRVEVLKSSEWGTICDDRWNLLSASVVCRELGFGSAKEALTGARMGQGTGPIHMNEVQCLGTEKSLWSCPFKNITQEDCKHTEDAAVRCNVPYMGYENLIRLSGGRSRFEGRVEVAVGAADGEQPRWGLVCGEGWGTLEAMVACRQLGLGFANHGLQETWYWDASNVTEMVLSGVKCAGHEMSLSHCQHHGTSVNCRNTGTRFAAGVICSETASDLLLHAPLVQETAYIEDRPLHMLYCAAEENCLSSSARTANWPYGHRRLLRFSSQIHNNGRADFRPKAGRHSWVWHECHRHYHSMDIFTHYDILTPNGTKVAEGHKASFCLEDTECEEDVAKRYECANFGEQGITVGCWDLYRHDIDCQWIDITDVKPGNYILQVVINPNFEVAESDFTNNAMKCNCKYDGHRIWVHSCHIGDALSEEASKRFEQYPGQLNNQIL